MDPLQQALELLEQSAAVISALLEMVQSKSQEKPEEKKDLSKQAEILAGKTGLPFDQTYAMLKTAEESGLGADAIEKIASSSIKVDNTESFQFGKPSDEKEYTMVKTARDKFEYDLSQIEI